MNPSTIIDRSEDAAVRAFAALGDPARRSILRELSSGTTCVCELEGSLGLAQNLLSYHLRVLREAGLVAGRRRGRRIEYRLRTEGFEVLRGDLDALLRSVQEAP